ncbi:uncharacterized protein JN550_010399 [Neoarthrinium moseri]|uniref:uncharacterized protein n=1 Tax=Neoarthrinium moseri TaxID=1658444 RepID=UPI001FDD4CF6|nr:uncharacterized protein JN550_010399 [Neoarthrinium moseri]KAI1862243.1 hypothetical protein JN550_010399 [Neoarthrinium moseri]
MSALPWLNKLSVKYSKQLASQFSKYPEDDKVPSHTVNSFYRAIWFTVLEKAIKPDSRPKKSPEVASLSPSTSDPWEVADFIFLELLRSSRSEDGTSTEEKREYKDSLRMPQSQFRTLMWHPKVLNSVGKLVRINSTVMQEATENLDEVCDGFNESLWPETEPLTFGEHG